MSGFFTSLSLNWTLRVKGRLLLLALVFLFALPAIIAKVILVQSWYQPGVTNKGTLIEPRLTYQMLSLTVPEGKSWHLGYFVPQQCDEFCSQQMHMLLQSYTALGKYQPRISPVVYISSKSALPVIAKEFEVIRVNEAFTQHIKSADIVIVDPLGQMVMKYSKPDKARLIQQSKAVIADLRKLLKLSRVG